jgi:hypothetical protein
MELDFEIDKITESIENADTGETLDTLVLPVTITDMEEATKKNGWLFDWKFEYDQTGRQVYKLVVKEEPQAIHGLVSLEKRTGHVFMTLIENAPFNIGKGKKYLGVACYEKTLGAVRIGEKRMAIMEDKAMFLLEKYFPETQEEL